MPLIAAESGAPLARLVAEQLFSRAAGAEPVEGNAVRLLRNGAENYPAWLAAIAGARRSVHFENYIIRDDEVGRRFTDALAAKAREGVAVQLLYDWLGSFSTPRRTWRRLREAGVEVRCFNRPRLDSPFGWLSRNHRKTVGIDDRVGFVSGLCVADVWMGDKPWRDTGIEVIGPAVADLDAAFAQSWAEAGGGLPPAAGPGRARPDHLHGGHAHNGTGSEAHRGARPDPGADSGADSEPGRVALRVIASRPNTLGLYRFDQVIAGMARRSLWLTDAYFAGTTAYVRALCDAARDGVDVRLLVPGASDIPVVQALSRAGYRPLLDAGIRVFEWNGPMLHAKTAVADGRWARIGSSNLNLSSWIGNWELDIAVEDAGFAAEMEAMFKHDLGNATEIVLDLGRVYAADGEAAGGRPRRSRRRLRPRRGSPGRLAAGAAGVGSAVGAAITNHRALGPAEAKVLAAGGAGLLAFAVAAFVFPRVVMLPLALVAGWVALTLLVRAWRLRRAAPAA